MSRTGLPIAALLLVACAGPPPPAPKTTIVLSPPIDSSPASSGAEADAAPPAPPAPLEPPLVALPEPAACVMTTSRWRGARATSDLRFREGGPIFARVSGGKASLHLPVGSVTDGAGLEVADESFALRGHLASYESRLDALVQVRTDRSVAAARLYQTGNSAKVGVVRAFQSIWRKSSPNRGGSDDLRRPWPNSLSEVSTRVGYSVNP